MNRRYPLIVSGAGALVAAVVIAGCGDYSDPAPASGGTAGSNAGTGAITAGTSGTGGSAAGTGGSAAGTGGSAGGTSGTGGSSAGTAGSAGGSGAGAGGSSAGTGGSVGGTAGSGASTAGSAGSTGGGGEPVTCDDLAACGGAVVGTYSVVSCMLELGGNVDLRGLGLRPECESAPAPISGSIDITGTWTGNEDGTYEDNTTTVGEGEFELAEPCLFLSGTTTTCDMISGPIRSVGFRSLTCVDNAETSGCTCTGEIEQEGGLGFVGSAEPEGSYTTMDSTLVTSAFGTHTEYSYCVANDKLAMTLVTVAKTGTLMGPIVLQKN